MRKDKLTKYEVEFIKELLLNFTHDHCLYLTWNVDFFKNMNSYEMGKVSQKIIDKLEYEEHKL